MSGFSDTCRGSFREAALLLFDSRAAKLMDRYKLRPKDFSAVKKRCANALPPDSYPRVWISASKR